MVTTTYAPGDAVPWHFVPSIVIVSFFASLMGTLLTVEILQRKRMGRSLVSRLHLLACSVSMSLIGIWCMHFIGNRSITLADGEIQLQLYYSSGYTGLSCVFPVVGLTLAFQIAELSVKSFLLRRCLDVAAGGMAGAAIVAMHYVGNLGAMNYTLIYPRRYIVAACIIAVGDSTIALTLFFYLKEKWINIYWKRWLCALSLAVGVTGMHFTASVGCIYRLKNTPADRTLSRRNIPVIVAAVLCFVAAVSSLCILFYVQHRNRALAGRAQHVMLACAFFDENGHIMITNEGTLPSQRIAKRFVLQKFDDQFCVHHPIFHWIWRVSHDWNSVIELVPNMRSHLQRSHSSDRHTLRPLVHAVYDEESYYDSTVSFREGYCVAAVDLAENLQVGLDQLGTLYDRVLGTGLLTANGYQIPENGDPQPSIYEKGQLLFFTRKVRPAEVEHYFTAGFRFAPPGRVEGTIANTMQIPVYVLGNELRHVCDYANRTSGHQSPKEGTFFVCFAALARVRSTFQVLVPHDKREQLPDVCVTSYILNSWQMDYLRRFDGWTAEKFMHLIRMEKDHGNINMNEEKSFVMLLWNALNSLADRLGENWFPDLVFSAEPLLMRYGANKAQREGMTVVFGFTKLVDIHQSVFKLPLGLTLTNWDFLRVRQNYYPGCKDQGRIRHEVHTEFGSYFTRHGVNVRQGCTGKAPDKQNRHGRRSGSSCCSDTSEQGLWTENGEFERVRSSMDTAVSNTQPWGGILATTSTSIEELARNQDEAELCNMTPKVSARATALGRTREPASYMDLLYERARSQPGPKAAPS